jgi:S1-C subfamily serine protease
MKRVLLSPFTAALTGGVVVAAILLAVGEVGSGTTKTVVQQQPIGTAQPTAAGSVRGLTARDIYKRDAAGVVHVQAQIVQKTQSPFDPFPQDQQGEATGSGFVVDRTGYILTNAHVVEGASQVTVSFEDKNSVDAKVVGRDSSTDIAVLKVNPGDVTLHPLDLGDSKSVQVGDPTIAIGNPFGLDRTLTTGVVSALQRRIDAPNGFSISNVIQTDAAINPGNSGGPLLDATGRVIGITSQIETGGNGNGNVGIGFAVPINTARNVLPQLKQNGRVARAYLGITGETIDKSLQRLNLAASSGVLVQTVTPGSPADKAGVRGGDPQNAIGGAGSNGGGNGGGGGGGGGTLLGGDVITSIDGKSVKSMDDVISEVNAKRPGDSVTLGLLRDRQTKNVTVKLEQRPNQAPSSQ